MENHVADIEETAAHAPVQAEIDPKDLLSTGSTLLDLALSDYPFGGLLAGKYYYFVGDSTSGKTFLSMTCFAEAVRHSRFKNYRLIYDNVEDGMLMDVDGLFGKAVAEKIEPPTRDEEGDPAFSETVEEFYYNVDDAIEDGRPFIYVLDSMDGLSSEYEGEKFQAHKRVSRGKGKKGDEAGSYGDGKAKKNSEGLRRILAGIRDTGSILIILSQTRDNLGMGMEKKTRSGGRALRFYATTEVWSSVSGAIRKTVKGKAREIGVHILLKVRKNRITGKKRNVELDIYPAYGIDDIGTSVDFLVEEEHWKKKKNSIEAPEFNITATREKLLSVLEGKGAEKRLKKIVGKVWAEVEAASIVKRKPKY